MTLAVTGAGGMIGRALCRALGAAGHAVIALVRRPTRTDREVSWDPDDGISDQASLEGIDGVIHLAGENIAKGRWTQHRMEVIRRSRVDATRRLVRSLTTLSAPPRMFFCASAVGLYGNRGDELLDESSPPGGGFLAEVCTAWEAAAAEAEQFAARRVSLRFGVVLSPSGGALAKMLPAFRWGLGAALGDGRQYVAWISIDDAIGAVLHLLDRDELHGAVNIVAPEPVRLSEFNRVLAETVHRPACLRVPRTVVRILLGQLAEETVLASARARPRVLLDGGYHFRHPRLAEALASLLG